MRAIICIVMLLAACNNEASKRVFTTSAVYPGNFGGLTAADSKCAEAAQAAALGGSFIALLSDSATNAIDRVAGDGPWALLDGEVAFPTRADIAAVPLVALRVDERGRTLGTGCSWTGSKIGAKLAPERCLDWTVMDLSNVGRTGDITMNDNRWIEGNVDCGIKICNLLHHFYCIEE